VFHVLGACPRLDESTADALDLARSSDPFLGMLKKGVSGVLSPLSSSRTGPYAPRAKVPAALLNAPF